MNCVRAGVFHHHLSCRCEFRGATEKVLGALQRESVEGLRGPKAETGDSITVIRAKARFLREVNILSCAAVPQCHWSSGFQFVRNPTRPGPSRSRSKVPNPKLAVITIISSGVAIALHMASCVLTSSFKLQSSGTGRLQFVSGFLPFFHQVNFVCSW